MTTLVVPISNNFSATALNNIDIIDFTNGILGTATATFANTQFNNTAILDIVIISGSGGTNRIIVNGGDVNASLWTFNTWTAATDLITINGATSTQNTLHGSTQRDVINGGNFEDDIFGEGGRDFLNGGASDDAFRFTSGTQVQAGLQIDGGTQTDKIALNSGTGYDFTGVTVTNVERLDFFGVDQTATFLASQIGTGKINTFVANVGGPATVNITGANNLSLSTALATGFGANDKFAITGTDGADNITGSSVNDFITGGLGIDILNGGAGDDTFFASGNDLAFSGESINGGAGLADTLVLDAIIGINTVVDYSNLERLAFGADGGFGFFNGGDFGTAANRINQVTGGVGVDTVTITDTSIELTGVTFLNWTDGVDTISLRGASGADVLFGSSRNDKIDGNGGTDSLFGGAGADLLDGGSDADVLTGGLGNDTYTVDNVLDIVSEAAGAGTGSDFINTSVSYTMAANTERLFLTGTDNINGTGLNGQVDVLTGNSGHNILNGLTGNDVMRGGQGSDTYLVDSTSDIVEEATNAGTDSIKSTATFTMTINTERLFLIGSGAIDGTGLAGKNDLIVGNNNANKLNGLTGNDELIGGLDADTFIFNTTLNAATNHDKITDFSVIDDTINLENAIFTLLAATGTLATGLFEANSIAGQSGSEIVIYDKINGDLYYDTNGAGAAGGLVLFADVANNTALTAADFVVI